MAAQGASRTELPQHLPPERLDGLGAHLRPLVAVAQLAVLAVAPRVRDAALAQRGRGRQPHEICCHPPPPPMPLRLGAPPNPPPPAPMGAAAAADCTWSGRKKWEASVAELAEAAVAPAVEPPARGEAERVPPAARDGDGVLAHQGLDAPRAGQALLVAVAEHAELADAKGEDLAVRAEHGGVVVAARGRAHAQAAQPRQLGRRHQLLLPPVAELGRRRRRRRRPPSGALARGEGGSPAPVAYASSSL